MTRNIKNKKNGGNKFLNIFTGVIVGMYLCVSTYLIINILKLTGIEDLLRYIIIGILGILDVVFVIRYLLLKKQIKVVKYFTFILILLVLGTGEYFASSLIDKGVSTIDKMNKDEVKYSSSLISMKNGKFTNKKSLRDAKIAITSDKNDVEGYVLAQEIIKKNKINKDNLVEYDDIMSILVDLYSGDVDAAFVSGGYEGKYSSIEKFEKIGEEVIELDSYSKIMKKVTDKTTEVSTKKVTEPFTILLLGVDSPTEDISKASGLGDSIMLVTFNPKTLNATIFSIPRDTYVPISCFGNYKNKITHAASGGDSCMIKTVENFTGIGIDYYAKVNFQGLIKLVDALGGIDVDVPYKFCESNSVRSLDDLIYVESGWQHLNGEQALALSRNRKTVDQCSKEWNQGNRNDFVRGQNQQLVIKGIMNKMKNIKSINQLYEVLDTISISLDTNLSREQMLGFYNIFKKLLLNSDALTDKNDVISMQKTYLNGSSAMIYDQRSGMVLYEFIPSTNSLNAIVDAMKINLEQKQEKYENSFNFSIDEPYEEKIIGMDKYGGSSVTVFKSFIGQSKDAVSSWCIANKVSTNFIYRDVEENEGYTQDYVIEQSVPANFSLSEIKGSVTFTLANIKTKDKTKDKTKEDTTKKDDDKKKDDIGTTETDTDDDSGNDDSGNDDSGNGESDNAPTGEDDNPGSSEDGEE